MHSNSSWHSQSCHLNIANPLIQSFTQTNLGLSERARFFKETVNANPALKEYYQSFLAECNPLKESSDPRLRDYWWNALQRAFAAGNKTNVQKTTQRLNKLMDGMEMTIRVHEKSGQYLDINRFNFRIRLGQMSFKPDTPVHVQGFLSVGPDPNRYALEVLPEDPAIRFAIEVAGFDETDQPFDCFITVRGEMTVKAINTLVDPIAGGAVTKVSKKTRRLVPGA